MRTVTRNLGAIGAAIGLVGLSAWVAFSSGIGIDYRRDGGPAIAALADGDLGGALADQPAMGSFSILLRAPLAALADAAGGGQLLAYRLGALACILVVVAAVVVVARMALRGGQSRIACAIFAALAIAGPMTANALDWGHPEELLAGALCVLAVILASRDRPIVAGVALALAVATKQWAVIAALPVLLAAPRRRPRLAIVAAAVTAALWLPLVLGSPAEFATQAKNAAHTYTQVRPMSAWFPLAERHDSLAFDGVQQVEITKYTLPSSLSGVAHPLIVLLSLPLTLLLAWRRPRPGLPDVLGLLALLFLLRCALDPVDIGYYHVPFLLALGAWELLLRRGIPLMTMVSSLALWICVTQIPLESMPAVTAVYLPWAAATAAVLAWALYGPGRRSPARGADVAPRIPVLAGTLATPWPPSPSTASTTSRPSWASRSAPPAGER